MGKISQYPAEKICRFGYRGFYEPKYDNFESMVKTFKMNIVNQILEDKDPQGAFVMEFHVYQHQEIIPYPLPGSWPPGFKKFAVTAYYVDLEDV